MPTQLVLTQITADGRGTLSDSARADLNRAVAAANLRGYPNGTTFPAVLTPGVPATGLGIVDDNRRHSISIQDGATLPPELATLLALVRTTGDSLPTSGTLLQGDDSNVTTQETQNWRGRTGALYVDGVPR